MLPLLVVALALALVSWGCGSGGSSSGSASTTPAEVAPDFTAATISGGSASLADFKGKPLVLNFGASWCGPCNEEAPVLVKEYQKYKDKVLFFGLAVKDDIDSQKSFDDMHGIPFPVGMDPQGDILYSYQKAADVTMSGIPTTFFVGSDGIIKDFYIGPIPESTFDQKVAAILPAAGSVGTAAATSASP